MRRQGPDIDIRVWPDEMGNIEDITYAVAWLPPPHVLESLPNLKMIFSLGAGVDAILNDPTLPEGVTYHGVGVQASGTRARDAVAG